MIEIDSVKWRKALQDSTGDKELILMALNIINNVYLGNNGVFAKTINAGGTGAGWRPLKDRYLNRKKKAGLSSQAWNRTGTFLRNVSEEMTQLTQGKKSVSWKKSKKVATLNVHNAIAHNYRGAGKQKSAKTKRAIFWKTQLRRPFVAYTDEHVNAAIEAAHDSLQRILERNGIESNVK